MIDFLLRLEVERQSLRNKLIDRSILSSGGSDGKYHLIMAFLVALMTWPVVPISLAAGPGGVFLFASEVGIFVAIVAFGLFLVSTVIFAPVGALIL